MNFHFDLQNSDPQVTDFFSYEHFYVIYCKFWELDKDHDLFIDREDLARHNDHGIKGTNLLGREKPVLATLCYIFSFF